MGALVFFLFGLAWGSFLNVVIYRLPVGLSLVRPGSFCPWCKAGIRFYDNIPLLSFIILQGRCRACGQKISWRYPAVELASGLLAGWLYWLVGLAPILFPYFFFVTGLLALSLIDLKTQLLPDALTFPLIGLGLLSSLVSPWMRPWESALGLALGGGFFLLISLAYERLRGRAGLGGGDVKLLAAIGALLGWQGILPTILVASFSGLFASLLLMAFKERKVSDPVPFGPFLSLGAIAWLFFSLWIKH